MKLKKKILILLIIDDIFKISSVLQMTNINNIILDMINNQIWAYRKSTTYKYKNMNFNLFIAS